MPSPEKTRGERIRKLVAWAETANKEIKTVDPILQHAYNEFPTVKKATVLDYAQTAYRILKSKQPFSLYVHKQTNV